MAERTPIPAGAYERLARQLRADMQRKQFLEQMQAARNAEDMKGRHSVGPDERRAANPNLISNALLAGTLGGAMSAAGLPAVGLRAGLIGGGATDAVLNAGNPEGGAEISGALAAAGALGRHSIPAAIAALGASSSEAAGMPFHSWMKRLNALNKIEPTAMYVNPANAELLSMMRDARETYPTSPTVRLLRDQRSNDVYGVEGSSILHDDMRKHLKLKYESSPGSQGSTLPELDTELHFLKSLPRLAGGGVIKRLGKRAMSAMSPEGFSTTAPLGALSVVKPKGGNWLSGSVEGALRGLKREGYNDFNPEVDSLNSWIEGPLTKYVKTRMASPEDEVRKLAEQGVLHVDHESLPNRLRLTLHSGDVPEKLGISPAAQSWENTTDRLINSSPASTYQNFGSSNLGEEWINKLDPNTPFYRATQQLPNDAGFPHLIDELSNALNPNSGLPPHLQLTPEAVKQMSMEKAVRRVADINAFRAAQQAEANRKLAEQASLVREYAENNPKGLRWVELKHQEVTPESLPEGWELRDATDKFGFRTGLFKKGTQEAQIFGNSPEEVVYEGTKRGLFKEPLERQLKYEGDTMGHCVGGYCPDVLEGRSRIFSLRDAKGEPHVTVEVRPDTVKEERLMSAWIHADVPEEEQIRRMGLANKFYASLDAEPNGAQKIEFIRSHDPELAAKLSAPPDKIIQIKGKQNRAPNPEYLPFVQDFVRNSPLGGAWSDVGDLQNAGLTGIGGKYFSEPELRKAYDAAGFSIPFEGLGMDYMDMIARKNLQADRADAAFLQALGFDFKPIQKASGGAVTKQPNPADNFQGIIAAIEEALA